MATTGSDTARPATPSMEVPLLGAVAARLAASARLPLSDLSFAFVLFSVLVATAGFGQYIFYSWETSPALIWPPAGIALAAVLLRGYKMWIPIAIALFLASLFSPSNPSFLIIATATFAQTLAPVAGAYLLKRYGFDGSFSNMRDALMFIGLAFIIAAIAPSIIVSVQALTGALPETLYILWTRSWAGRLLSILVLTPLLTSWIPWRPFGLKSLWQKVETASAFGALSATLYVLFWTPLGHSFSFILLAGLLALFVWMALRLNVRATILALFLLAAFGMAGPLLSPQLSETPLNQRLFSIELFIILIAPIFIAFSALTKERRDAAELLKSHIDQMELAMQELNSKDEAKNEFIAILAHELRNPLAAILSSVELLKLEGRNAPDSPALLKTIAEHVRTTATILDDLLDISRISQNKLDLSKEVVALCDTVDRSVATTQFLIHARGHTLSVTKPPEKIYLEADPVRLEQVFVNLLNNAAKYTEPGGTIGVSVAREGKVAMVRVRDSGVGIPKHMLTRIFEPFFQIERKKYGSVGLGIGLSLTRRLVEMHGGTIEAVSDGENHGSEFVVRLPVPVFLESSTPVDRRTLQGGRALKHAKHTRTILVVDDNEAATNALGKLLRMRGHNVELAYTGAEALEQAGRGRPQIAIVDIQLPDLNGYDVARRLRDEEKKGGARTTLVALTGYGQNEDKEKARRAGFDYHLTKPVGLKEIEVILRKTPPTS